MSTKNTVLILTRIIAVKRSIVVNSIELIAYLGGSFGNHS